MHAQSCNYKETVVLVVEVLDGNKPSHETDALTVLWMNGCTSSSIGHNLLLEEREQIHLKKLFAYTLKYFPSFIEFKYQLDV